MALILFFLVFLVLSFVYFSYFLVMQNVFSDFQKFYGKGQFLLFFSMYYGIKKAMDLWISDKHMENFSAFCKQYDILFLTDIKFQHIEDISDLKKTVIWGERLTSTKFIGADVTSKEEWRIHLVLSRKQEYLDDIFKYSWYPIISNNRVIHKSVQDFQDFWDALWYPHCCRKFFFEKNNWLEYSFLYEIYKQSFRFDYRCNCFWKDNPKGEEYSYIYHMPCHFACEDTINYAQKIEEKLEEKWHSKLLEDCRYHLKLPCLVVREQKIYAFEWEVSDDSSEIRYTKPFFLWNPKEEQLSKHFDKWNIVQLINKRYIDIYKNSELIHRYDSHQQNEIEIPFIIQFH